MRTATRWVLVPLLVGANLQSALGQGFPPRMPNGAALPNLPSSQAGVTTIQPTAPPPAEAVPLVAVPAGFVQTPQGVVPVEEKPPTVQEVLQLPETSGPFNLPAAPKVPDSLQFPGNGAGSAVAGVPTTTASPGGPLVIGVNGADRPLPPIPPPPTGTPASRAVSPAYRNFQLDEATNPVGPPVPPVGPVVPVSGSAPYIPAVRSGPLNLPSTTTSYPAETISPPAAPPHYLASPPQYLVSPPPQPALSQPTAMPSGSVSRPVVVPSQQIWFRSEVLLWWMKSNEAPPLVAQQNGINPTSTRTLFPDPEYDTGLHYGLRGTLGMWFTPEHDLGFLGSYFWIPRRSSDYAFASAGAPALVRPFFDTADNTASLIQLSNASGSAGRTSIHADLQIEGGDANVLLRGMDLQSASGESLQVAYLVGYRYLNLEESLSQTDSVTDTARRFGYRSYDLFQTRNQFHGGQIGATLTYEGDYFWVNLLGKLGIGNLHQQALVDGGTYGVGANGAAVSGTGGLFALADNIGHYERNRLSFLPELTFNVGLRLTSNAVIFAGYNLLYMTNVWRPGDLIDPRINSALLPLNRAAFSRIEPQRTGVRDMTSDFWAQGVTLGFAISY